MSDKEPLKIIGTDWTKENELIVEYSNGSTVSYTVEQLRALEPKIVATEEGLVEKQPLKPDGQ
jgi:hypothetical protein